MKDKRVGIPGNIAFTSLLSVLLFSLLFGCKGTPNTPEVPEVAQGSIQVNSSPEGAIIWLDNKDTFKNTPALLTDIPVGNHALKLTKYGYQDFERTVFVPKNQTTTVNAELERIVVRLISPEEGAVLDNGRSDSQDDIVWDFDWSDVAGAAKYHLYVKHLGALYPVINCEVYASSYHHVSKGSYIVDSNRFNWKWKVRVLVDNMWSEWSEERSFDVEPLNTDPPS